MQHNAQVEKEKFLTEICQAAMDKDEVKLTQLVASRKFNARYFVLKSNYFIAHPKILKLYKEISVTALELLQRITQTKCHWTFAKNLCFFAYRGSSLDDIYHFMEERNIAIEDLKINDLIFTYALVGNKNATNHFIDKTNILPYQKSLRQGHYHALTGYFYGMHFKEINDLIPPRILGSLFASYGMEHKLKLLFAGSSVIKNDDLLLKFFTYIKIARNHVDFPKKIKKIYPKYNVDGLIKTSKEINKIMMEKKFSYEIAERYVSLRNSEKTWLLYCGMLLVKHNAVSIINQETITLPALNRNVYLLITLYLLKLNFNDTKKIFNIFHKDIYAADIKTSFKNKNSFFIAKKSADEKYFVRTGYKFI